MAVKEYWEIKWILWVAVQEDWTTMVSTADTINIVWGWTVTDVWGVATINIPQWVTWYREDVTAWSATYTFVNSPATSTSFLIFTDSGTLLFSGIDYTYDPDTETVTFLSLWANEAAYIWVAHAIVLWGWIWDMVKSVYDPTNINASAFDYNNFINTPTIWTWTLTIQKNSTTIGTFGANDTANTTVDIIVPTTVAELSDASSYVTTTDLTTTLWSYVTSAALTSTLANYVTNTDLNTAISDFVKWPASAVSGNIAVYDGNTGKIVKDSWLNIQIVNSPMVLNECKVYYENWTIYIYPPVADNILLEDWEDLLAENGDNLVLEY